jgi:phage N-6-adenine-methyltransferase
MTTPRHALFSRTSDEWATPSCLYAELDAEFGFTVDAAATAENATSPTYITREQNALVIHWSAYPSHRPGRPVVWLNPPYSGVRPFLAKAVTESSRGCTVVCLVPSRTDTRWWHESVWDASRHRARLGVDVRFLKGRLRFSNIGTAPFPSALVIMRAER